MFRRTALLGSVWLLALGGAASAEHLPTPPPPQTQRVAPGVWLIPGGILPMRQPDGNTVIFEAPQGLVVMDTGRHPWHRQAILDFAAAHQRPIVAIVNSHWHLDHVSGDPALKAAYPAAKFYASRAIDAALTGFLAKSAAEAQPYLDSGKLPPETAEDVRADMATIKAGQALRPDVVIEVSEARKLGGRRLQVNLAAQAATAGDVWVFDPKTRVVTVGDLVTLPAPFLDTACAKGWSAALGQVWATPFRTLIPGHGPVMDRAQFALYRQAFDALVDCAGSSATKTDCAAAWTTAVTPLLGADPVEPKRAQGMTEYYVADVLRANGGKSAYCEASPIR
jgi:glyoxylase-like metal-dependent hydrolase (beta-lactamase superfamily II)